MIDATRLAFDPLIPWLVLGLIGALAAGAWMAYLNLRGRAWLTRGLALTFLALALANPTAIREERDPLPSVAALVLDRSESMAFGERKAAADVAFQTLKEQLEADPSLDLRTVKTDPRADGTEIIATLEGLMADVPRDRIAGAIILSDGQVHDVPERLDGLEPLGPIHSLIVGDKNRGDRRVEIIDGPRFGIVGESARLMVRVEDPGEAPVPVFLSVNGGDRLAFSLTPGEASPILLDIERRGENVIVVEVPAGRQELTLANNRTALTISGVRDRLRVLLITGRPNASGRVWRDLLKSDPQVDLVHFTILRPTYKPRVERIEELALIPFPYEELFEEKLPEFDLIIFDQYERAGIITMSYLSRIVNYVDNGGALLIAAGEPFAGPASLALTPLAGVLPASPTGQITTGHFVPDLTEEGRRHSVTAPLDGRDWGGWFRYIQADAKIGDVLMSGPGGEPLLVVDRVGQGRVGQLMSDQIWLWARGHEGGGPFAELIRRLVHWMMKEPELEERRLELRAEGSEAEINLRTLSDDPAPLSVETPEGTIYTPEWQSEGLGQFSARLPIDGLGLYRARAGGLEAVALNGLANPREYENLQSVEDVLRPVSEATDGGVWRVNATGTNLPNIRRVGQRAAASGNGWLGLRERDAYTVRDSRSQPLLPGLLAMALVIAFLMLAWRREGR